MEIVKATRGKVVQFDPVKTQERTSVLDAAIMHAKKMKDWPTLRKAVDLKIKEQRKFVTWWDENTPDAGNPQLAPIGANCISIEIATEATGIRRQQVDRWRDRLEDAQAYRVALYGHAYRKAMAEDASVLVQQSISAEHYTPAKYIEAARSVLGDIDLDPASCAEANRIVKAAKFFDFSNDGLAQPWEGRVWLNPPYGRLVGVFIEKLIDELNSARVPEAIALVNAHCTDTAWFQMLWDGCLCFTDHRINFLGDAARSGSTHGSVFIYFGDRQSVFADEFKKFGAVVARVP